MTENKRFHFGYVLGDTGLIDEQAREHKWFIENCCSVSDLKKNWNTVCDKLNELSDENEQLKQSNQKLNDELQETIGYLALKSGVEKENEELKQNCKNYEWYKQYKTLLNENEELKKENLDLSEELDYCKTKCASLETGLFQADKENGQLKLELATYKEGNETLKATLDKVKNNG